MDTCIACNENSVDITELYCFNCYLDREAESMIEYANTHNLFISAEAK